jgi:DNA replication and repair protein RecF
VGLTELTLRNFRLFEGLTFSPDPAGVTVLVSPNGTGKTSVLEATHLLATAHSFRTSSAADVVRNGSELAEVHGVATMDGRRIQVDLTITRGQRTTKRMLVNGQRPTSRRELAEVLPLTVFTPEGVDVVRGGPEHRRAFLTVLEEDIRPVSADLHERFARVVSQRNSLLRTFEGQLPNRVQREQLDVWNEEFVAAGEEVVETRLRLLDVLASEMNDVYTALAGKPTKIAVNYEPSWSGTLLEGLDRALRDDVQRGYSTVGPHRDDIAIEIDGRLSRRQASQGEQRSLALALRLAGHHLVARERGLEPLLLLDDVFSELDPRRSDALLGLLPAGQTLVTTATPLPSALHPANVVDLTKDVARG